MAPIAAMREYCGGSEQQILALWSLNPSSSTLGLASTMSRPKWLPNGGNERSVVMGLILSDPPWKEAAGCGPLMDSHPWLA